MHKQGGWLLALVNLLSFRLMSIKPNDDNNQNTTKLVEVIMFLC